MQFCTLTLAMVALLFSGAEAATLKSRRGGEQCTPGCFPTEPACPVSLVPKNTEDCWKCCIATPDDSTPQEGEGPVPIVDSDQLSEKADMLLKLAGLPMVRDVANLDRLDELANTIVGDDDGQSAPPVTDTHELDELIDTLGLAAVGNIVNVDNVPELINSIIGDAD